MAADAEEMKRTGIFFLTKRFEGVMEYWDK